MTTATTARPISRTPAAAAVNEAARLQIVEGRPLPAGWTGKLWAVKQGVEAAQNMTPPPDYLLLTDADIVYRTGRAERPRRAGRESRSSC